MEKRKKININTILSMKSVSKITCITSYDYTSAKILDAAGVDMLLVGDSLGMVMQGNDSTVSVTLDEVIYHTKMVKKGSQYAFIIADIPLGYFNSVDETVANCIRVVKETDADAVKLEGATAVILEAVSRLTEIGVNVVGHIGLQPQTVKVMGGYKAQGFDNSDFIKQQAIKLQNAGVRMIVLEGLEVSCAADITKSLTIPTIGIGAGADCDGQVLVFHDMFGFYADFKPRFVKRYADVSSAITQGATTYIQEVKDGVFPSIEHTYRK